MKLTRNFVNIVIIEDNDEPDYFQEFFQAFDNLSNFLSREQDLARTNSDETKAASQKAEKELTDLVISNNVNYLECLPDSMIDLIFSKVDTKTCYNARLLSKMFHHLYENKMKKLRELVAVGDVFTSGYHTEFLVEKVKKSKSGVVCDGLESAFRTKAMYPEKGFS